MQPNIFKVDKNIIHGLVTPTVRVRAWFREVVLYIGHFSGSLILPLNGYMYMLAVYYVRSTNMSQINVCQQLFRAVHRVRLNTCLSLLLKWTTLTAQN